MRIESNRLCLVTGLPASRAISTKNPAYNGGVLTGALQTRRANGKIIPWEVLWISLEKHGERTMWKILILVLVGELLALASFVYYAKAVLGL